MGEFDYIPNSLAVPLTCRYGFVTFETEEQAVRCIESVCSTLACSQLAELSRLETASLPPSVAMVADCTLQFVGYSLPPPHSLPPLPAPPAPIHRQCGNRNP